MPPDNLNDKLKRFSSQLDSQPNSPIEFKHPERYRLLADSIGGELVSTSTGCYCLIRTTFPVGHTHGVYQLKPVENEKSIPSAAFSAKEESIDLALSSMLFLDIETTGLGGTGAAAFLIGLGKIAKNGFEILQFLIPDYSDEAAMLQHVYDIINQNSTMVSFNGASFDMPVLLDRMIINRISRQLDYNYHLDLLHSARRLFKRRLADCTLINLERQLFSFYRTDDIPGYLVPSVYFEWLSSQDLTNMKTVLGHNRLDILSLYFLTHVIAAAYQSEGASLSHSEDLYSLSRFFERRKETVKIENIYYRVKEEGNSLAADAALHYARNFKRTQNFEQSVQIWESIAIEKNSESYWACVELAKYYEHQVKDLGNALEFTNRASKCELITDRQLKALEKRVIRLNRKLSLSQEN